MRAQASGYGSQVLGWRKNCELLGVGNAVLVKPPSGGITEDERVEER